MYVSRSVVAALTALGAVLVPAVAHAQYAQVQVQVQQPYQPQQPVYVQQAPPPPPPDAVAPNGQYVAPMQQQTQQTYVPQSVAMSGPRIIRDWHEGDPIPPGYHPESRIRTGLVTGGATMFGVPYLISILTAAIGSDSGCCTAMWVPVVGPFIQMGAWNAGTDSSAVATGDVFLVIDGVLQAAGVAMFVYGLAVPKTVLVRNDLGMFKNITPTPIVSKNMTGIGVTAQF